MLCNVCMVGWLDVCMLFMYVIYVCMYAIFACNLCMSFMYLIYVCNLCM